MLRYEVQITADSYIGISLVSRLRCCDTRVLQGIEARRRSLSHLESCCSASIAQFTPHPRINPRAPFRNRLSWINELFGIAERYDPLKNHECTAFRGVYKSPLYDVNFEPAEEKEIQHYIPSTPKGVTNRVLSWSAIAPLSAEEKERVKEDVANIIKRGDELVWIDKDKCILQFHHDCLAVIIRRKQTKINGEI